MNEILPVHPFTGLQAIGIVGGRPVWPIKGGSDDHGASEGGEGANGEGGDGNEPETSTDGQNGQPEGDGKESKKEWTSEEYEAEIKRLRAENASARVDAKKQAADDAKKSLAQDIGKALGLVEDENLDPEKLKSAAAESQAAHAETETKLNAAEIQIEVFKLAWTKASDGDPVALVDSREFINATKDIDPSADDFSDQVSKAVSKAVEKNPRLAIQPGAKQGGNDMSGGTGKSSKPKSLESALETRFTS